MINPIKVIKDGVTYQPEQAYKLQKPFLLSSGMLGFPILEGEEPIYFKRNTMKISKGKAELVRVIFCIGKKNLDKTESYVFIDEKQNIIQEEK